MDGPYTVIHFKWKETYRKNKLQKNLIPDRTLLERTKVK